MTQSSQSSAAASLPAALTRTLLDAIADVIFFRDAGGVYRECNAALAALLGRPAMAIIGKTDQELFGDERADELRTRDRQLLATGETCRSNEWFAAPDGRRILYETIKTPVFDSDGSALGVFGIGRDITEMHRNQATSKNQARFLSTLLDAIPDVVFFKDTNGVCQSCNSAFATFIGRTREDIVGRSDTALFGAEMAAAFREADRVVLESGQASKIREWVVGADGQAALFETAKTCILGTDGRPQGLLGISRDVTEERRAEEKLRKLSERLILATRAGGVGTWDWDVVNDRNSWDDQMLRIYGITCEAFGNAYAAWQAALHPDDRERAEEDMRRALSGEMNYDVEFRIRWPNGTIRHIHSVANVERDTAGQPVRVIGTNWDITARVEAEQALHESEANFRTFFETLTDLVLVCRSDGHIQFANQATSHLLGYAADELLGRHVLELHPADTRAEAAAIFTAMLSGERRDSPLPLARRDGSRIPMETRVWHGKWNGTDCLFAICKDLTAEQEAKQRFETLFHNNPCAIVLVSLPDERFVEVNDAFLKALGYSREEMLGRTTGELEIFVDLESQRRASEQLMRDGFLNNVEIQLRRKDGSFIDELYSIELVASRGQQFAMVVMVDITLRKQAEAALNLERDRLAGIIQGTHVGTWEWNVQTGEVVFNERWAEIVGYSLAELAPMSISTWMRLAHPDDLARSGELLERHFNGEAEFFEHEARMRHRDGHWIWILDRGQVLSRTPEGRPLLMLGTHQDITQRKQAEEQIATLLNVQREMTRLATEFINVSMDRQDQAINRSLAMIGQLTKTDRTYLFAYDFAAGTARNTHEWCAEGITPSIDIAQAIPFEFMPEAVVAHRAGELVQIPSVADLPPGSGLRQLLEAGEVRSVVTLPLITDGSCHGFVGFDAVREERVWQEREIALLRVLAELYANFEARRNAERETRDLQTSLIESRDAAQAAAQAKSLFLANMSHEIRTPLNAVLGYAQIMQRECQHCPTGGRLNAISRSGEHLLELLNDLLELVRSDAHQIELAPCDLDFHQVLADVRMMFVRLPDACGLELEFSHRPEVPRFIHADSAKVRQILVNLVGNAVKFTKQGTVRVAAAVLPGGGADGYVIAVAVEDTGCGIAPEEMERIFEIFEQAQPGRKNGKGVGLGLALSRRYARAMGGDVTVDSRAGGGSRFQFTFRARPVANSGADAAGRGEVLQAAPNQPVRHLLVVDDEPENREMLTDLLTAAGFSIETADTAEQALARLAAAGGVDLVLMDKRLPGMDGYQAIARLRELPGGRTLPVVVVTASGAADEQDLAFAAGADGYAAKPVKRKRLLQEIGRLAGVEYEYGEPPAAPPPEPAELAPDALARVPITQRELLAQTLRRGDVQTMRELIAGLADEHAALADRLGGLVEIYDYDSLNTLLEAAKGDPL
jgi:PAS domain S-box-containing protein